MTTCNCNKQNCECKECGKMQGNIDDSPKIYTYDELKKELEAKRKEELKNIPKRKPYVRLNKKIGRNEKCTCGSGKKYKKCCGA